ncbi:hypothetical protein QL285_063540 [Trifolium repens]|nr:hypothetical protein QL285_063540 [Trifolium repens]
MAARPSSTRKIVQKPFNPVLPPVVDLNSQASLVDPSNTNDCGREGMEFFTECFVDFESLRVNGVDIKDLFYDEQWENYFEMLNGFVYYDLVKNFWNKAYVYDKAAADEEVRKKIEKYNSLRGKTRVQMGLRPFKGKEIRSNLVGIEVVITQEHIAKMLGLDNEGELINQYKVGSKFAESIKEDLFPPNTSLAEFGKAKFMKKEFFVAFRIFMASIVTRDGGTDTISWSHKHFVWFMLKRVKINLADTLFEHLCHCISESHHKPTVMIHHPLLISELLRQSKLIEVLRTREKLRVFNTSKFDGRNLINLKLIQAKNLITPVHPLQKIYEKYFWCDGFPTISEHDNEDVINNFLEMVREETNHKVDRSMVVAAPDWDVFNNPKEKAKTRAKKTKAVVFEEPATEAEQQGATDEAGNVEKDKVEGTSERQEAGVSKKDKSVDVQKERMTKKSNERPSSSDDDNVPLSARILIKRQKTVASKPPRKHVQATQGKTYETNTFSTSEAQHAPTLNPDIDVTIPISMILPDPQPTQTVNISSSSYSSDSDCDDTISDSSEETIDILIRRGTKSLTKTSKAKEFVSDGNSILDHLASHMSGDAFTSSNLNSPEKSPIHTSPMHVDTEQETMHADNEPATHQVPPNTQIPFDTITTPHPETLETVSETPQENLNTETIMATQPAYPLHPIAVETILTDQTITNSQPLTMDDLVIPSDQMLPLLESLTRHFTFIDDQFEPPRWNPKIDISNIKIIPLKRKKPEPKLPYREPYPSLNQNSEPNVELLSNAINISLKNFLIMEEEAFIFPSYIDAEIRALKAGSESQVW